jgi:PAS domain S-box-containing protein
MIIQVSGGRPDELSRLREVLQENFPEAELTTVSAFDELNRASAPQLQAIIDHTPAIIFVKDLAGRYRLINRQYEIVTRLTSDEVIGKTDSEIHPKDFAESVRANDLKVISAGEPISFEESYPLSDGLHHYLAVKFPLFDSRGQLTGICGISADITALKRAEASLRESEHRFRSLAVVSPTGIFRTNAAGDCLYVNQRWCEITGLTPEQGAGQGWTQALHPEDRERVFAEWSQAVAEGRVFKSEYRLKRPDGRISWVLGLADAERDQDHGVISFVGTITDITERREAEAALAKSENLLRLIIENEPDCVKLLDARGCLLQMNRAGLEMIEAESFEQVRHAQLAALVKPQYRESFTALTQETCQGRGGKLEFEIISLKGRPRWLATHTVPLRDQDGRITAALGLTRDVTEQRQAENETSQRLRELTALYQASLPFAHSHSAEEIGHQVIIALEKLLAWKRGSIWLLDPTGREMHLLAHSEMGPSREELDQELRRVRGLVSRPGVGISGWVALHGAAIRTGDVSAEPRYVLADPQIQSELCVPLQSGGRTIGSINVESELPDAFSQHDERLLMTLASEVAIAVENARLFDHLLAELNERRRAEEQLSRREKQLRQILNSLPALVGLCDSAGRALFGNRRISDTFMSRQGEGIGKYLWELPPWDGSTEAQAQARSYIERAAQGETIRLDLEAAQTNHGLAIYDFSVTPIFDESRQVTSLLVSGVDITERRRLADERQRLLVQEQAARDRMSNLSRQLMEAQENESRRIARELHDEIGQSLTALKFGLEAFGRRLEPEELKQALQEELSLVDDALQQVRNLPLELRPTVLDDLGLVAALRSIISRQSRRTGLEIESIARGVPRRLPVEIGTACFRVCQEALTNISRHARAARVRVELKRQNGKLNLTVEDDGVGFDPAAARAQAARGQSMGLLSMQERAQMTGGELAISSTSSGTIIRASFPLPARQKKTTRPPVTETITAGGNE